MFWEVKDVRPKGLYIIQFFFYDLLDKIKLKEKSGCQGLWWRRGADDWEPHLGGRWNRSEWNCDGGYMTQCVWQTL